MIVLLMANRIKMQISKNSDKTYDNLEMWHKSDRFLVVWFKILLCVTQCIAIIIVYLEISIFQNI